MLTQKGRRLPPGTDAVLPRSAAHLPAGAEFNGSAPGSGTTAQAPIAHGSNIPLNL